MSADRRSPRKLLEKRKKIKKATHYSKPTPTAQRRDGRTIAASGVFADLLNVVHDSVLGDLLPEQVCHMEYCAKNKAHNQRQIENHEEKCVEDLQNARI